MADLVVDVGNTRVKLALCEGEQIVRRTALPADAGLEAGCEAFVAGVELARCGGASVAPAVAARLVRWCAARGGPPLRLLGQDLPVPLPLAVSEPRQVGADRIANAAWAARAYPGQAALVFDLGTAITLDAVDAAGRFVGGAIAAGIRLRARALHQHTALLPEVALDPAAAPRALGQTTRECIEGGLVWGTVGLVEALARQARAELGAPGAPVILTGGDAAAVAARLSEPARLEPDATLRGVLVALEA